MVMGVPTEALQKLFELAYKDKGGNKKTTKKQEDDELVQGIIKQNI
jgi:hypothetical protein